MNAKRESGYVEIPHTADWSLKVWAPDLSSLFRMAAEGMCALMEVETEPGDGNLRAISLQADDPESLLVAFLSEILFLLLEERQAFEKISLSINSNQLQAALSTAQVRAVKKEIKAVTFYHLRINRSPEGLDAVITFDV